MEEPKVITIDDVIDSTVMHVNDFPRPNSTLTRPLCILMIFLDLTRHLLDSNPANYDPYRLLSREFVFESLHERSEHAIYFCLSSAAGPHLCVLAHSFHTHRVGILLSSRS